MTTPETTLASLRETQIDQTKRLPVSVVKSGGGWPVRLFADHAFAARIWFMVAAGALGFCVLQPYLIIRAYRARERVVVLDGAGSFSVSPLLGFEEAKDLHEAMALWATLAMFQRNPKGWDYPDLLQKLFLADAATKAGVDREKSQPEFSVKNIHQKPEVFKIDILRTREDRVLVKVEGQLVRTGVMGSQTFGEAPTFTVRFQFVRNPNLAANGRYPLAVWTYDLSQ